MPVKLRKINPVLTGTETRNINPAMEKCFAFDLGRVIFDFDYYLALKHIEDKVDLPTEKIHDLLFNAYITADFERGLLSGKGFYNYFKKLTGLKLSYAEFLPVWNNIFSPKLEMIEFIKNLQPFYYLVLISNINRLHFEGLLAKYPFIFSLFDQLVLSYKVKAIKPEEKIYKEMINAGGGNVKEIIYIDDRWDLVLSAQKQGIKAIQFNSLKRLISILKSQGVMLPTKEQSDIFTRLYRKLSSCRTICVVDRQKVLTRSFSRKIKIVDERKHPKHNNCLTLEILTSHDRPFFLTKKESTFVFRAQTPQEKQALELFLYKLGRRPRKYTRKGEK